MIDINAIISQALAAAVQQATAPLLERIAALETRLLALENNPAQGVDTTLNAWEMAMQNRVDSADAVAKRLHERVLALENLEYLDNQEWFWNKIRRFTDGAVESAIEQHCEEYDHDDMVMKHELPDMDDYVTKDDLDSEVRDAVRDTLEDARIHLRF